MSKPGRFIVVEGLEGAGKTSAIETIKTFLKSHVPHLLVTREPGGTRVGESLRALIKEQSGNEAIDSRCELLMMYAARVQLVEQVIRPALMRGDWVLSDRFELSTYAYQGGGRGINQSILDNLSLICLQDFKPDLTLFLDIPPELGLERILNRGKMDRIEQESIVFFNKVYRAYHDCLPNLPNVRIIDASAPIDKVQEMIIQQLEQFLQSQ